MKTILKISALLSVLCASAFLGQAQNIGSNVTLVVSFNPDPHDAPLGIVQTYSLWMQPTNATDTNKHQWLISVQPNTSTSTLQFIQLNATNLPANCLLFVTADGLSANSDWSAPYFYDYPALIQKMKPNPVTGINVQLR